MADANCQRSPNIRLIDEVLNKSISDTPGIVRLGALLMN